MGTSQRKLLKKSKFTSLVWDVDSGGSLAYVGAVGMWETSIHTSQFCWGTKTALKKIVLKKTKSLEEANQTYNTVRLLGEGEEC